MTSCSAAAYVAYRREDAEIVGKLIKALKEELGAPPDWCKDWFFVDTSLDGPGISPGDAWLHKLTNAHRNAVRVLGIMSERTMPSTKQGFLEHAVYIDELTLAQTSGRLAPVILGERPFDLPLGLNVSQSVFWTGKETETVRVLAAALKLAAQQRIPETNATLDRRQRWLADRRRTNSLDDQLLEIKSADLPLVFRHIIDPSTETDAFVTSRPISVDGHVALDRHKIEQVVTSAMIDGVSLRLLWVSELLDMVAAPADATEEWRNPFDLALAINGLPLWAIDEEHRQLSTVSTRGKITDPQTEAALWLTLA